MSKERARRREAREQEAAAREAERQAQQRRDQRRRALVAPVVKPFRRLALSLRTGRQSGIVAERRRKRISLIIALLIFTQVLVWFARPDWQARLAAALIALLAFPVIAAFAL